MDLENYDTSKGSDDGAEVQIIAPNGDELDFYIRVLGMDSDVFRRKSADMSRERAKRALSAGKQFNRNKLLSAVTDPEKDEEAEVELLSTITLGWRGKDAVLGGKVLPYSLENCKMLYRRFRWIRKQVDEFVGERANFLPSNASSSSSLPADTSSSTGESRTEVVS